MTPIRLNFAYKGKRDYIQGPDILDGVIECLSLYKYKVDNLKYSAHNWIRNNASVLVNPESTPEEYGSLISYFIDNIQHEVYVIDSGESITQRNEYSEDYVFTNSVIQDKIITLTCTSNDISFSELIVSMNKCYLQSLDFKGKWIVTKLEYTDLNSTTDYLNKEIKIKLIKNLKNKLTKSEIYIGNNLVGHIFFSLV